MEQAFTGNPAPLAEADFDRAAMLLGCSVAAIKAVAKVESLGSGYLRDGRPKILFERHVFHRLTRGLHSARHPHISQQRAGGYLGSAREYDRLAQAMALDRQAALKSASWGAFQIMGFNHVPAGFATVELFVQAMVASSAHQLDAFAAFIRSSALDTALRQLDWQAFAKGYNGRGFAKHRYDEKMARAYRDYNGNDAWQDAPLPMLRTGHAGAAVRHVQALLSLAPADGLFGPGTRTAVAAFQRAAGLAADGIVGDRTWAALAAHPAAAPGHAGQGSPDPR